MCNAYVFRESTQKGRKYTLKILKSKGMQFLTCILVRYQGSSQAIKKTKRSLEVIRGQDHFSLGTQIHN